MNVDNGHLVELAKLFDASDTDNKNKAQVFEEDLKAFIMGKDTKVAELGYTKVPKELETAAKKKLAGKDEAFVSLTSGGKLSKWAAKQRKDKKKAAKLSRRKNR